MLAVLIFIYSFSIWCSGILAFPEEGKWHYTLNQDVPGLTIPKSLFAESQIFVDIMCESESSESKVTVEWFILESNCWNFRLIPDENEKFIDSVNLKDNRTVGQKIITDCTSHIMLNEMKVYSDKGPPSSPKNPDLQTLQSEKNEEMSNVEEILTKREVVVESLKKNSHSVGASPLYVVPKDGFYTFVLKIKGSDFSADVQVEMLGKNGYLSAADWPLLPFYGVMCLVYVFFGVIWLIVSFCQWRELLRIQFWIGGVILLGMLEKAIFYAEYQNINSTGINFKAMVLLAEWVSCAKRTLARMLVIIVSLGFGIVKPRLGSMLHRLVGVGACYFILAVVEGYIRVMHPKNDSSNQLLIASIPLAVLDSAICWWIFTALIQTTRTLRLRRNLVKLSLYRHFTNTLIFAVLASVIFMLYSIKVHRLALCVTDWKNLWIDEAYWHILFSVLLLVIMILWRPTNNNQRYAFTPLLDAAEDDEEEDQFVNDAYGVKMRTHSRPTSPKPKPSNDDDILKWVDENIPSAAVETALPIFDSEEEILTTKYEMSKMQ